MHPHAFFRRLRLLLMVVAGLLIQATSVFAQPGLIINEISNGPAGDQEYIELLVIGDPDSCTVDLRGWIVDDNNGDFSCGPASACGIASGHIRFSPSDLTWSFVPRGALIVLYNGTNRNPAIPPDDPFDIDGDSVYIVPVPHPSIEITGSAPNGSGACPGTGNSGYSGAYTASSWATIGMRNTGDAAQVRDTFGVYFHGISFGNSTQMTGGPDNLLIFTGSGTGRTIYFNDGSFTDASNFTRGTVPTDESPGLPNNSANAAIIPAANPSCLLPVIFSSPLIARPIREGIELNWATNEEIVFDRFEIQRASTEELAFETIAEIPGGQMNYRFFDPQDGDGQFYYRLRIVDQDGSSTFSRTVVVTFLSGTPSIVFPNPARERITIPLEVTDGYFQLFDLKGRTMLELRGSTTVEVNISHWAPGIYFYRTRRDGEEIRGRLVVE